MSQSIARQTDGIDWHAIQNTRQMQLGTAAWLHESNLRRFQNGDVWLGRAGAGEPIGIADDRHVLVCSGSRSGKGTTFIIPNLCMWRGSCVVIDPKGENAIVTARRRADGSVWTHGMGQKVRILDPFRIVTTPEDDFCDLKAGFNPLDALRPDDPESVETSFRIADGMIAGERSNDPFFDDSAKDLISYVQLHVASWPGFAGHERNLLTVRRLLTAGDERASVLADLLQPDDKTSAYAHLFASMKQNPAFGGVIARAGAYLADLEANSPRLFGSIAQVARTNTRFIDGESMQHVLGKSSFGLSDLKTSRRGVTVYLCLPQRAMESHYRWLRLMVALIVNEMERVADQPVSGYPVMMMLDEFPALRRMRTLENAAAQIAGYGVKLVFITQTLVQLKDEYKDNWETFVANAGVKFFSCNDDHFTRDYVSKLIGDREVIRYQESGSETVGRSSSRTNGGSATVSFGASYSSGSQGNGSMSFNRGVSATQNFSETNGQNASVTRGYSTSIHKRALISPDEVGRLFGDRSNPRALVLISGQQPAALNRTAYFKEALLAGLYGGHPAHAKLPTLTQRQVHAQEQKRAAMVEAKRLESDERNERFRKAWKEAEILQNLATLQRDQQRACNRANAICLTLICLSLVGAWKALSLLFW